MGVFRFSRCAARLGTALIFLALSTAAFAQRTLAPAPADEQRVALVIGNAAYKDAPLRNPVNDAADIASSLRELGFRVTLRTNASQRQMKEAMREFGEQLARGGVGVFYFAGHGIQLRGRNFLVPIGADIQRESHVEDETVDGNFVLAQMEEARNRVNIVIIDACRNNPYTRSFRSAGRGLAPMDAAHGSLIAFATAPGSVAADGDGRNGVYTKHLLRQLREPGVPVELMLKRVRDGVMDETRNLQVPWESSSLRGADFFFRPPAGGPQMATVAPAAAGPAAAAAPIDSSANDRAFWESVKDSKNPEELRAYLDQFPAGQFAALARARLEALQAASSGAAAANIPTPPATQTSVSPAATAGSERSGSSTRVYGNVPMKTYGMVPMQPGQAAREPTNSPSATPPR